MYYIVSTKADDTGNEVYLVRTGQWSKDKSKAKLLTKEECDEMHYRSISKRYKFLKQEVLNENEVA